MGKLILSSKPELRSELRTKLSARQIRFVELLLFPAQELKQALDAELMDNPILEEVPTEENSEKEDQDPKEDYEKEYSYSGSSYHHSFKEKTEMGHFPYLQSRNEELREQLSFLPLKEEERQIGEEIIGNLDQDGYLRRSQQAICDDLLLNQNLKVDSDSFQHVLRQVQSLEPAGIAATSLEECLLLQLENNHPHHPQTPLSQIILKKYFHLLSLKHYKKLEKALKCTEAELKGALEHIGSLHPRPGWTDNDIPSPPLVPDFILTHKEGDSEKEFLLRLHRNHSPEIRISSTYERLRKENAKLSSSSRAFLKEKWDAAKWWMETLSKRRETLLRITHVIVEAQAPFLRSGDVSHLQPLLMKEVAARAKVDISTVSRTVRRKTMQTPYGIFPLSYFFADGLISSSEGQIHDKVIKHEIEQIIKAESKEKPFSDQQLSEILDQKGFSVARRTVAKYREYLHIPVARMRKEIH
ncbi:MAG: RNA polymerase factor sigma-54 [Cytophagales bacterium]|nr:RNA polymerase factor sigma-54 [Cytophagales bacterium]